MPGIEVTVQDKLNALEGVGSRELLCKRKSFHLLSLGTLYPLADGFDSALSLEMKRDISLLYSVRKC